MLPFIENILKSVKQWTEGLLEERDYVIASHINELHNNVSNLLDIVNATPRLPIIPILYNATSGWEINSLSSISFDMEEFCELTLLNQSGEVGMQIHVYLTYEDTSATPNLFGSYQLLGISSYNETTHTLSLDFDNIVLDFTDTDSDNIPDTVTSVSIYPRYYDNI